MLRNYFGASLLMMTSLYCIQSDAMFAIIPSKHKRAEDIAANKSYDQEKKNKKKREILQQDKEANNDETVPDDNTTKQLYQGCLNYLGALEQGLGCGFCKTIQNFFDTDKALHIRERIKKVKDLSEFLLAPENNLVPFAENFRLLKRSEKSAGTLFYSLCTVLLANNDDVNALDDEEVVRSCCLICWQNKKEILLNPCSHLAYDKGCYDALVKGKQNACPTCSAPVTSVNKIDLKICMECFAQPSNILAELCGHAAICEDCDDKKNQPPSCKYCKRSSTFKKIYY